MAGKGKPGPAKGTRPSGRKKGTPNKNKQALLERIQSFVKDMGGPENWHPLDTLAFNAVEPDLIINKMDKLLAKDKLTPTEEIELQLLTERAETIDNRLAQDAAKEVAKYVAPQLKAIEHTADKEDGAIFQIVLKDK